MSPSAVAGSSARCVIVTGTALPSVRAATLERLIPHLDTVGFTTPDHVVIRTPPVPLAEPEENIRALAEAVTDELDDAASTLENDRIFVRACPHDESVAPHLSFAGIYHSYVPPRRRSRRDNVREGMVEALVRRSNEIADYYYERHGLPSERIIDLWLAAVLQDAAMVGTAYACGGRSAGTYFDTPLSMSIRDRIRFVRVLDERDETLEARIANGMVRLEEVASVPLDVEFIVTRREEINVIQARPMSAAHIAAWRSVPDATWEAMVGVEPPSAHLNSMGTRNGDVLDLRVAGLGEIKDPSEQILVVSHQPPPPQPGVLDVLRLALNREWTDLTLVIDHSPTVADDHLSYIIAEDPAVSFVVHMPNVPSLSGSITIDSDGFAVRFS